MAGIKKKVDVHCYRPFKLGIARFAGYCNGIILDADAISICLQNKAMVNEVLKNGKRVPLDFSNYNQPNPMGYDVESEQTEFADTKAYKVTSVDNEGTTKVNNVKPKRVQAPVQEGYTAPLNTTLLTSTNGVKVTEHKETKKEDKKTEVAASTPQSAPVAEMTASVTVEKSEEVKDEVKVEEKVEITEKKDEKGNSEDKNKNSYQKNNKHHK